MTWGITAAAGASLVGGLMSSSSAKKAAQIQANAQIEAARMAAEEARFRPVGVTTRFGQSQFQTDENGRVSGAGYTLDPAFRAYQDRFMGLAGGGLSQAEMAQQQFAPLGQAAQGLFGLGTEYLGTKADPRLGGIASQYLGGQPDFGFGGIGSRLLSQSQDQQLLDIARRQLQPSDGEQAITSLGEQYLAQSPQAAAEQYMASKQNLLAPTRERQFAQLQNQLFQTGRGGLAVGGTGLRPGGGLGFRAANPEMEAYYNAQAQQDAQLADEAQQAGQQRASFGAGLLSQGQALGQGRIGFGAGILSQQQAQEAQRLGLGSSLVSQQDALERGRYGFGADLLARQQAIEQGRASFGAGLFGTGGNLLTQGYQGQTSALGPYEAYLAQMRQLEILGQDPFALGINIGAKGQSTAGAQALYGGGMASAQTTAANAYNPYAQILMQAGQNPTFRSGLEKLFSGSGSSGYIDPIAYGSNYG